MTDNHVFLIGRLGAAIQERVLPSGTTLLAFHVVVDRERPDTAVKVDALPCHVTTKGLMGKLRRIEPGTQIEVQGALRRRFWKTPQGLGSAVEIHVTAITRA